MSTSAPRAGDGGGELVFGGRLDDLLRSDTATSRALNDRIVTPSRNRRTFDDAFRIEKATSNKLRNLTVQIPKVGRGLQLLVDVGVGYLRLGQSLSTLSGGEAQHLKLASELTRSGNVYVMDEPTTGLHPADIDWLLGIVDPLIAGGNTVFIIEHNLDVIAAADWIVDLGPESGRDGGAIVAEGTPETIAAHRATSHTGRYLKERLAEPLNPTTAAIPLAMSSIPDARGR